VVSEHPFGEVDGSRRGPQRRGDDEPEDIQHAGDEADVLVVAAGRPVGMRGDGVEEQPDPQVDRRDADGHRHQGDHEAAPLAKLLESRGDHGTGRDPRSPVVLAGRHAARGPDWSRYVGRRRHWESPRRLVTCRNHDSSDACMGCNR
jgi:hypothetical protein